MRSTIRVAAVLAGLWAALSMAAPAGAQTPPSPREGFLYAASYVPIPVGTPISIHLLDDNDSARELGESFRRELTARGYKVVERSNFTVTFWLTGSFDTGEQQARRALVELGGEGGTGSSRVDNDAEVRVNLFSTRGGGLFQDPDRSSKARSGSRYRLYAAAQEVSTGKRAWIGQAVLDASAADPLAVADSLVPVLASGFGQTVRRQPFNLP
jgi:hypothetical protein